jgi:tetratricopeptide (TPR) repeat protein
MPTVERKPIRVFYSYAHEDERYREELEKRLTLLQRQGVIEGWHASLIRRDIDDESYTIHRLVQMVLKHQMDEAARRQWAERCVRAVNRTFPNPEKITAWPLCERLLPHALICVELVREWELTSPEVGQLCHQAGFYLYQRGRYEEVEPLFQRALKSWEAALGPQHPNVATGLNNLAAL